MIDHSRLDHQNLLIANKPKFITFTGVDEHTSIEGLLELSQLYPIEWGILFSPKHQGVGRYPPLNFIRNLVSLLPLTTKDFGEDAGYFRFSAHLCGGDARSVIERGTCQHDEVIGDHFVRAQINTVDPKVIPNHIRCWADRWHVDPILQCRGNFPNDPTVAWLFDASGGHGISPENWPVPWHGVLTGYAGGLRPNNVANAVDQIGYMTDNYWLDMETGVRDGHDRFDLAKCRAVCEAVYGVRG